MRKTFRKGHFMEALLVLVSLAALLSTASGNLQVQQTATTSITTYSSATTATSYTLTTVVSTTVFTVSATFLSTTSGWVWATSYTSNIATVTNIVARSSIMIYPVVTVFISVRRHHIYFIGVRFHQPHLDPAGSGNRIKRNSCPHRAGSRQAKPRTRDVCITGPLVSVGVNPYSSLCPSESAIILT